MDGVLADFASAFREIERELFGSDEEVPQPDAPEDEAERTTDPTAANTAATARQMERRRRLVWDRIRATENFWTTLKATDPDAVRRLQEYMLRYQWEVVFITQRPATAGETVQRQTQRWLVAQGFDMPSVLVVAGSRGAAINALRLTHHVDDSPQNCVDVRSDSRATPILIVRSADETPARQARALGIRVATSIGECLTMLEQASGPGEERGFFRRLAAIVNWSR